MEISEVIIDKLANAESVAVLTGAGISAESGIKTFRDKDGLWAKFSPEELASMDGFLANPKRVWEWYNLRMEVVKNAEPNPGHFALAELEAMYSDFSLATQNIDRLHQRAGSKHVLELHGNLVENFCNKCHAPFHGETALPNGQVPLCPECGGNIRPAVVWFGENLPAEALLEAEAAARRCDVYLTIGTSGAVYPAAGLPLIAAQRKAFVVEINPKETEVTPYFSAHINGASGVVLPELVKKIKQARK